MDYSGRIDEWLDRTAAEDNIEALMEELSKPHPSRRRVRQLMWGVHTCICGRLWCAEVIRGQLYITRRGDD